MSTERPAKSSLPTLLGHAELAANEPDAEVSPSTSIAPIALDAQPSSSEEPANEPPAPAKPINRRRGIVFATLAGALVLIGVAFAPKTSTTKLEAAPAAALNAVQPAKVEAPAQPAADPAPAQPVTEIELSDNVPAVAAPRTAMAPSKTKAPARVRPVQNAAKPKAPARPTKRTGVPGGVGTVKVSSKVMTVMVDGNYRRVRNGRVVLACGEHHVSAGRGTKTIQVPCGGVTTLD